MVIVGLVIAIAVGIFIIDDVRKAKHKALHYSLYSQFIEKTTKQWDIYAVQSLFDEATFNENVKQFNATMNAMKNLGKVKNCSAIKVIKNKTSQFGLTGECQFENDVKQVAIYYNQQAEQYRIVNFDFYD